MTRLTCCLMVYTKHTVDVNRERLVQQRIVNKKRDSLVKK